MGSSNVTFFYCFADVNNDKRVDMMDLWLVQKGYGKKCGMLDYDTSYDVNDDCIIDMTDLWVVQKQYGKRC